MSKAYPRFKEMAAPIERKQGVSAEVAGRIFGAGAITLLAPRDVGRRLQLSTSRVVQLDRENLLPALRDSSGRRFYDPEVVERFAEARVKGK